MASILFEFQEYSMAALQFNTGVIVRVNLCFAANLDLSVFEVDSFVDKS